MKNVSNVISTLKGINFCCTCTTGANKEGGCIACERKTAKDLAIKSLEKHVPQMPIKGEYNEEHDNYSLKCACCDEFIGSLDNEDADGIYKFNIFYDYCHKCGQAIEQNYKE